MNRLRFIIILFSVLIGWQYTSAQTYSQELVDKANAGDTRAQYKLYVCYIKGSGVAKDETKAIEMLIKSANGGYKDAINTLAVCYAEGDGVVKDLSKAIMLWKKGVDAGDEYAMSNLAKHYESGEGVEKDSLIALDLYRKAAEKGKSSAQQQLGWYYYFAKGGVKQSYVESLKWFEKSGTSWSHYMAGWQYEYGQGVQKDYDKSAQHYRRALPKSKDAFKHLKAFADKGYVEAMYQLGDYYNSQGWAYENGYDYNEKSYNGNKDLALAKSNYEQSHIWLEKAANMKHGEAACWLGIKYNQGSLGFEKNDEMAMKWFRVGESVNHRESIEQLARMIYDGEGTEVNYDEIVRLCNKDIQISENEAKAEFGDEWKEHVYSPLYSLLGDCYLDGLGGLPKDGNKAFELYNMCETPESYSNRGYCYRYGIGTQKDYKKAFECYKDAADFGAYYYLWNLGSLYEEGVITQKDTKQAFEIYEIVSNEEGANYIPEARNDLARCYLNGIGTTKDEAKAFQWYKLSADDKDEDGECGLGVCYYNGYGVRKDYNEAFKWFNKTIDDHPVIKKSTYSTVLEYLSKCYRFGRGCTVDVKKADECLKKAESMGSTTANDMRKYIQKMNRLTK